MKRISDYTIYCTPEQTIKALKLGAPIELWSEYYKNQEHDFKLDTPIPCKHFTNGYCAASCPTAEQMIGWLEEQRLGIDITSDNNGYEWSVWVRKSNMKCFSFVEENLDYIDSRKEATLAAIDAALEYLSNNKK